MVHYWIGSVFAVATLALAIGAIRGRVRITSCCAPADPAHDRRMQLGEVTDGRDEHRAATPATVPPART